MSIEPHFERVYHFPMLHKGDCFYDILSRYHAQSGHLTSKATSMELFGTTPDLAPAIYLPYRAGLICSWLGQDSAVTPELIRDYHSAWQYLQLSSEFSEEDLIPIMKARPRPGRRKQRKMVYTLQNRNAYLKFCPLCLVNDYFKETEAFWHQVHQVYGVNYCPIHGTRLFEDDIFTYSRLGRYVTASEIMSALSVEELLGWGEKFNQHKDPYRSSFLALGKTIAWLLEHGLELGSGEALWRIYNRKLGIDEERPLKGELLQELLLSVGGMAFLKELFPGEMCEIVLGRANRGITEFSPLEHALVITALSPQMPEGFL